jgi:uncharacterized integral membrane protein
MAFGYVVVALVAAAVAIFALQNGDPTPVRFLVWTIAGLPLAGLILLSLAGGLVIAGVPLLIQRWQLRGRLRAAERRLAELQDTAVPPGGASRARGLDGPPSPSRSPGGPTPSS